MLPGKQGEHWKESYDSARNNEILNDKTTLLIHLAAAMAFGCDP